MIQDFDFASAFWATVILIILWLNKGTIKMVISMLVKEMIDREAKLQSMIFNAQAVVKDSPENTKREVLPQAPNGSKLAKQVTVMDERLIQLENDYLVLVETKGFKELMRLEEIHRLSKDGPNPKV